MPRSRSSTARSSAPAGAIAREEADRRAVFALTLGRPPESLEVVATLMSHPFADLLRFLFASPEFGVRIQALSDGTDPFASLPPPGAETAAWAARRLPLSRAGRARVQRAAWSWSALFLALAQDSAFVEAAEAHALARPEVLRALSERARARGAVERADAHIVSGWALGREENDEPARLELWIDGAFAGAATADRFRRDVQDLIGGDGHVGFVFYLPPRASPPPDALVEVRTAGEGVVLGAHRVALAGPRIDDLVAVRSEIALLRAGIERLERFLPVAVDAVGGGQLSAWAVYFDAWYADLQAERPDGGRWAVVIDAAEAEPVQVQASLAAVVDQALACDRLLLIAAPGQTAMAEDLVRRARLLGSAEAEVVNTEATDPADRVIAALARARGRGLTLLVRAGDVPGPSTLALLTRRFLERRTVRAIYVDEDRLDVTGPAEGLGARHGDPMLKPGPDPDLLLQTPYVGRTLAFRSAVFEQAGLRSGLEGLHGAELLLRLMDTPGAVDHLPLALVTRTAVEPAGEDQARAWRAAVTARLAARGETAVVVAHEDILGAAQSGAVSVRRAPPDNARATVIIPTRDRLDLLVPCIDSLLAHRAHNATAMDILVVDHESCEPATLDYLKRLRRRGLRVIPHQGPFNWALINNSAAAEAKGDVLVFLNNDTVILSPDWLDALVAQASRPEVGAVGCRLVYADGTLQHAGFVSRGSQPDFLIHDGVGVTGEDGGYLGRHALTHASAVVTGACMAVATGVFRSLGGFDAASFPVEGNDADFCFRARAAGLRVLYEPRATLYHLESKSRGFSGSGEKRAVSQAADRLLRERWALSFGDDPGFNPHFDRRGRPFERLGTPPLSF
jgi:GT2 family glycosyltransferase